MTPDYLIGGVMYVAAAPVEGCIAFVIAFLIHRLLSALRLYRWVWHPVLFDTALFLIVWTLMVVFFSPSSSPPDILS